MQKRGPVDGLKVWEQGWDSESFKKLPRRFLDLNKGFFERIVNTVSPSSSSSSSSSSASMGSGSPSSAHTSNYLSTSEKKRLGITDTYLTAKEELAMSARLAKLLRQATETGTASGETEEVCRRDAWGARGMVGLLPPRGGTVDLEDAAKSLLVSRPFSPLDFRLISGRY